MSLSLSCTNGPGATTFQIEGLEQSLHYLPEKPWTLTTCWTTPSLHSYCGWTILQKEDPIDTKARRAEDDATASFGSVQYYEKFQATNHHLPEGQRHYLPGGRYR